MALASFCKKNFVFLGASTLSMVLALLVVLAVRSVPCSIEWHAMHISADFYQAVKDAYQHGTAAVIDGLVSIPAVERVWLYTKRGKCTIGYLFKEPLVRLSSKELLTKTGEIVAAKWFAPEATERLPYMTVDSNLTGSLKSLALFAEQIPAHVFESYDVVVISPSQLRLQERARRSWTVFVTTDLQSIEELLLQCEQIKERDFAKAKHVVFDARFRGQIVARIRSSYCKDDTGGMGSSGQASTKGGV